MSPSTLRPVLPAAALLILAVLACSLPGGQAGQQSAEPVAPEPAAQAAEAATAAVPSATTAPIVTHLKTPGEPGSAKTVYDVESQSTASERRAPYGDSYDINRLERPFEKDMTYVSDLDIYLYKVSSDTDWWYVQI